ncbi:MAG: hypothetical protein CVU46_13450 [Chloroflexi bacterium HGW-Chloroflexi-8]|nr:MAG: hypothetical protein CVU46_13450 [Chloroflexi bacterium HGW-Chloroflexi-8]
MKTDSEIRENLLKEYQNCGGIFRLLPTWVARNSMPSGLRLGLSEHQTKVGDRGWISERWLGSTTKADNQIGPPDEGLSYLNLPGDLHITLKQAIELIPEQMMGKDYADKHHGLKRLPKIFDMSDRIAFHFHHQEKDAKLIGRNSKEEAYYFPVGKEMGKHPETFFGVHPYVAQKENRSLLLPPLIEWKDDRILKYSRAYQQFPEEGFHVPAGIPHAPGTALTLELQEDSDVFAILQAYSAGSIVPKSYLFKDTLKEDQLKYGEALILDQINWELSGDPFFYENRHTTPQLISDSIQDGGQEFWIFYNTMKFSGKKLMIHPSMKYESLDKGVYNILVWQGQGLFDGLEIKSGVFEKEELLITHERAMHPIIIENTGKEELVIFKFFGPEINIDVPMIKTYP